MQKAKKESLTILDICRNIFCHIFNINLRFNHRTSCEIILVYNQIMDMKRFILIFFFFMCFCTAVSAEDEIYLQQDNNSFSPYTKNLPAAKSYDLKKENDFHISPQNAYEYMNKNPYSIKIIQKRKETRKFFIRNKIRQHNSARQVFANKHIVYNISKK